MESEWLANDCDFSESEMAMYKTGIKRNQKNSWKHRETKTSEESLTQRLQCNCNVIKGIMTQCCDRSTRYTMYHVQFTMYNVPSIFTQWLGRFDGSLMDRWWIAVETVETVEYAGCAENTQRQARTERDAPTGQLSLVPGEPFTLAPYYWRLGPTFKACTLLHCL